MHINASECIKFFRSLSKESKQSPFHPFLMFDVVDGTEVSGKYVGNGLVLLADIQWLVALLHRSLQNVEEATLVVDLVKVLFDNGVHPKRIGVITPYKAQVKRIQNKLKEKYVC